MDEGVDYFECEFVCVVLVIIIIGFLVCDVDNESYMVDFLVIDVEVVYLNDSLLVGIGLDFFVLIFRGQNVSICVINECDSDNRLVEVLDCNELCLVIIMIFMDGNFFCNDDNEIYIVIFSVEGVDFVFVNEVFYVFISGNMYILIFLRGVRICIFVWKYNEDGFVLCRVNREVEVFFCCEDFMLIILNILIECNDDNEIYILMVIVLDVDEVCVNGELVFLEVLDFIKYVVVL